MDLPFFDEIDEGLLQMLGTVEIMEGNAQEPPRRVALVTRMWALVNLAAILGCTNSGILVGSVQILISISPLPR